MLPDILWAVFISTACVTAFLLGCATGIVGRKKEIESMKRHEKLLTQVISDLRGDRK